MIVITLWHVYLLLCLDLFSNLKLVQVSQNNSDDRITIWSPISSFTDLEFSELEFTELLRLLHPYLEILYGLPLSYQQC